MDRREYLFLVGAASTLTLAGCSSNDDEDNENGGESDDENENGGDTNDENLESASVSAENHEVPSPVHTITIEYAANTTSELQPPNSPAEEAAAGMKFVVIHGKVTVESELDSEIDMYGSAIGLQAGGIIMDGRSIRDVQSFTQTVVPGTTFDGWTAFEVSADTTEAMLVGTDVDAWFSERTAIQFEKNDSLSATLPEE